MKDQSASGILATAIDKIKDMVDCQTIIGDPIDAGDGIKVIPISKVTYGFARAVRIFRQRAPRSFSAAAAEQELQYLPLLFLLSTRAK